MDLFYYMPANDPACEKMRQEVQHHLHQHKSEVFSDIHTLKKRLARPLEDYTIGILCATNKKDLDDLLAIDYLLEKLKIILLLSDSDEQTIALAHKLRPRFLSYIHADLKPLTMVLQKMIHGTKNQDF